MVRPILEAVRKRGDKALLEYARQLRRTSTGKSVARPGSELSSAAAGLLRAFRAGRRDRVSEHPRVRRSCRCPRAMAQQIAPGLRSGQIVRPLDTVAAYIPGGPLSAALDADDDGDPGAGGRRAEHLRRVARRRCPKSWARRACWASTLSFRWAARTPSRRSRSAPRTVPRADRIVGPGNIYVAAAKKLLAGEVGIDFVAGPTEI